MALVSSQTTHAVNHTVTVAATTLLQTLTHTATPRIKTATITTSLKALPTVTPDLPDPISQIIASWPECVQPAAFGGIAASGCVLDSHCICRHGTFRLMLLGGMTQNCTTLQMTETQSRLTQLCPNLEDSRSSEVVAVLSIITILALISVVLRLISRRIGRVKLWWDDYLIVIAMVITLGETANMFVAIGFGLGKHIVTLSMAQMSSYLKTFWIVQVLFSFSVTLVKMSILCFYRRIFVSQRTYIAINATGCFLIAWFLAQFISVMLSCRPIEYFWDRTIPNGKCIDENIVSYAITAASLLADLIIFGIPIPSLLGLKRSVAQRAGLISLFLTAALVCIAGAVRIPFLIEMDMNDLTWSIVPAALWIAIETKIGIVCACLPTLLPLFRKVNQGIHSRLSNSSSSRHNNNPSNTHQHRGELVDHLTESKSDKGGGCPNCSCANCGGGVRVGGSRTNSIAKSEKEGKRRQKQRGWYSAALSNLSRADRESVSESQEEIVGGCRAGQGWESEGGEKG